MIDKNVFFKLIQYRVKLEEGLVLWCKYSLKPYLTFYKVDSKTWDDLIAEGYLTNSKNLTAKGTELCEHLFAFAQDKNEASIDRFEEFWQAYPPKDGHGNWRSIRQIRTAKNKVRLMYRKLVPNIVSHEDLMKALEMEICFRKTNSISENQMKYMAAPYTWLYNGNYLSWLENIEDIKPDIEFYGKDIK